MSLLLWKVYAMASTANLSLQGTEAPTHLRPSTLAVTILLAQQPPSCPLAPHRVYLSALPNDTGSLDLPAGKGVSGSKTAHSLVTPSRSSFPSADPSNFWFPDLTLLTNLPSDVRGFRGFSLTVI